MLGTLGRYAVSSYVARKFGESFPFGTLAVNTIGCFLAGGLLALFEQRGFTSDLTQAVLFIGFLGGFTTFSAFGLQTFTLIRAGEIALATINLVSANVLGVLLVWAGYSLGKLL